MSQVLYFTERLAMLKLKKTIVISVLILATLSCFAEEVSSKASWRDIWQLAQSAEKGKKYDEALELYEKSAKIAQNPKDLLSSYEGQVRVLRQQKKNADAEKLLLAALEREDFTATQYRRILNQLASLLFWTPRRDQALNYLNQARFFHSSFENDRYATYSLSAYIYQDRKEYEAVIEIMKPWAENIHAHPANQYAAAIMVADAWLKLEYNENAKKYYKKALTAGKKVTYKFDYSKAEKKLEELGIRD